MVGVVRDLVVPMKAGEVKGEEAVFTIVCEILTTPVVQDEAGQAQVSTLWKMASAWRVISFFLVVFVLPTVLISLPLYARYHLYHARHMPMTETDTRALNHAVSSFWCQGQRVTSNGTLDAFLVAGTPQLLEQRRHVTLKRNLTLRHDDIEYWGVYLLQGSTFALSSCSRWPGGVLLVVRGEDNLRKCFYREHRLENELNGGTSPVQNVYKSPPDVEEEEEDGGEISEQRHWEDENVGGEVFDDDYEERTKDGHSDLSPLAPNDKIRLHKYDLVDKVEAITKRKNRRNKKDKKERHSKVEARHGRSRRSRGNERRPRSAPLLQDSSVRHEDPLTKPSSSAMDLLHKFNDTVDVLTGNSSFSSSEEFLEQCRDAILKVDLTPYIDWESRISKMDATNPDFWRFNVNSSDYYYFIFTSDNSIELNHLGFNLQLDRATYDVSSPLESCRNSTECVFSLAFTQTEAVVVEVPAEENLQELHSFEVTTTCQPRVPVYMVFILLVPFIILLFAFQ
ncbi:uncharacterized protein [Procambarus clarkii]|uniref:uncharacterized protein isoform X2 n=1 Tax=Procambarus clarkii TaxID=6728 RepID=UPI003743D0E5